MQVPFLFNRVFAGARPLPFTTKDTKSTKRLMPFLSFVLFVLFVVKKKTCTCGNSAALRSRR